MRNAACRKIIVLGTLMVNCQLSCFSLFILVTVVYIAAVMSVVQNLLLYLDYLKRYFVIYPGP